MENKQAGPGRDDRTFPTKLSDANGDREISAFPVQLIGKSLEHTGSVTGEVVLCSELVGADRDHRRYMEPRFIIISQYPTSWAYFRNIRASTSN